MTELTGRARDGLRPAGGRQGPDRRPAGARRRAALRGLRRRLHDLETRAAAHHLRPRRRRRTSWTATSSPAATASTASAAPAIPDGVLTEHEFTYPFGWLGHPRRGGADDRRADLRLARARLRAVLDALADGQPPLPAGARPTRSSTHWPDDRIWEELQHAPGGAAAGASARGRSSRRASRRCAPSSASRCARAAVPGRRRRAHRAADRRQGPQPRRQRRAPAGRRAGRATRDGDERGARRLLATPRCAASGAPRTSRTT